MAFPFRPTINTLLNLDPFDQLTQPSQHVITYVPRAVSLQSWPLDAFDSLEVFKSHTPKLFL